MLIKRLFSSVFGCRSYKPSLDDQTQKLQPISTKRRKVVTFSTNDDQSRQKQQPFFCWGREGDDQQYQHELQQCQSEVNDLEDECDHRLDSCQSAEDDQNDSSQQSDSHLDDQESIIDGQRRGQLVRESSSFADELCDEDNDDSEVDSQKQDSLDYSESVDDESENEAAQNCGQKETIRNGNSIKTKRSKKLQSKISTKAAARASYNKPAKQTKKLFEDAVSSMRTLKRSLDQSFKSVDELNCPICMDYIVSCRTAICGHSFCETCINESLIHRKECPNCRKDIRKWVLQKSDIIDGAVKHMVRSAADAGNKDELTRYEERVQAHQTWMDKQEIQEVKPGEKVDALDTEYIWCKAQVELKIRAKGRKPLLYLHYDGWSRKYDEYVYMDSRRIAPVGHFTSRNDIPRYASNGASRQPMNYAHVIDSARNMQNADQIENAEHEQNEGNDPAAQINAISEEVEGENENSYESLNRGLQAAEEPDPERLQDAQRPRRGPGLSTTSLNRDSHVGRSQEDAPASNSVSTPSRLQRFRPQTRSHRAHQSVFHSHRRQNNPFSAALYFQSQLTRDGSGRPVPSSTRRQTASQEPTAAANLATRTPNSGLNRSVFQFGSSTQAARGASQQQTNSGDAQGASNGNSTTQRSIFDAPAPLYTQVRGRRSSVPSNNTGNIMRGSGQSNAFGGGAPSTNPFLASNTSSNQNRLSLASRYETSLPTQHTCTTHRPPRFPAVGANTTTQTTTTGGLEQPQRITVNFGDRPSTSEGGSTQQVRPSPFTSSQRRTPFSPQSRVTGGASGNNVALETCPIPPPSFGLLQDSNRLLPSPDLPQLNQIAASSTSQATTTNQNNDNNQQQQTVEPEAQHQNATSPQQQANPEDNSDSNNWVIPPPNPNAGQPDRGARNHQLGVAVSSFQDQDAGAQEGGVIANNEANDSVLQAADAQGANSASQQDQQQPQTQTVQLVQQQSNQSQSGDTESKRQNKE